MTVSFASKYAGQCTAQYAAQCAAQYVTKSLAKLPVKYLAKRLSCSLLCVATTVASADPSGGAVAGGAGIIHHHGSITEIHQLSNSLAIDWSSFNVHRGDVVNFIQPGANAIVLNRISGNSASQIQGQINANAFVVLVNPQGIFFGENSSVNVGGLIASGLDISTRDFMNGDYVFKSVEGTSGAVVNGGFLNAAAGGTVTLLGKQVVNNGLISANLGVVTLASGKEAVLTFDTEGLVGVKISKEFLQNELGIDPAVINNGEINAKGGKVLLTARQSQDVFSQAVNTGNIQQATRAIVHADGSFSLTGDDGIIANDLAGNGSGNDSGNSSVGAGGVDVAAAADSVGGNVVNTGSIDVSAANTTGGAIGGNGGQVVLLGENVTHSGSIKANAIAGNGGDIEIHATDTTLLTENSVTTARAEILLPEAGTSGGMGGGMSDGMGGGKGGTVKILGNKVGVTDNSVIDVSGTAGGGKILIGGDYQGKNPLVKNADRTYVGRNVQLIADALNNGNGGKIINWGNEATGFYGSASAKGGDFGGDGGLVEISGKSLFFDGKVNTSAANGNMGTLLFDPTNITIFDGNGGAPTNDALLPDLSNMAVGSGNFNISENVLEALAANTKITLEATNNITINDLADDVLNLQLTTGSITFTADSDRIGGGDFTMNAGDTIRTQGGAVTIDGINITAGTINTTGADDNFSTQNVSGGAIALTSTNNTTITGDLIASGGLAFPGSNGNDAGAITVNAGQNLTVSGNVTANGSSGDGGNNNISVAGGNGGAIILGAGSVTNPTGSLTVDGAISAAGGAGNGGGANGTGGKVTISSADKATLNAITAGLGGIDITAITADLLGDLLVDNSDPNSSIILNADVLVNGSIQFNTNTGGGSVAITGNLNAKTANADSAVFNTGTGAITIDGAIGNINTNRLSVFRILSAGDVSLGTQSVIGRVNANQVDVTTSGFFTTNGFGISTFRANQAGGSVTINANTSITTGSIFTSGSGTGNNGGNVTLNAQDITVGTITARGSVGGSNAGNGGNGGAVALTATGNSTGAPSITLNGNIDTRGGRAGSDGNDGTTGAKRVLLTGTGNGTLTIGTTDIFTGTNGLTVTSTTNGTDTIVSADLNQLWFIDSENNGSLRNSRIIFKGFENLVGGSLDDTFRFTSVGPNTGSLSGLIDGGGSTGLLGDTVDASRLPGNITVEIGGTNTAVSNINITNIETVTANAATNNTLIADSSNPVNNWNINTTNGGTLNTAIAFSGFANLTGGITDDAFVFTASGSIAGLIDGGGGAQDSIDVSALVNSTVQIGNINNGNINVINFDRITANAAGNNTLIADNTIANVWAIDRVNGGTLGSTTFDGFANLTGGDLVDTFDVTANGAITGVASGGRGDDIVTITLSGAENGSFTFDGGDGSDTDTINIIGGNANYAEQYDSDVGGFEQLSYAQAGNNYVVAYTQAEIINDSATADTLTINGTAANDTINFDGAAPAGAFTVNAATQVNYSNKTNLAIDGLAGTDAVTNSPRTAVSADTLSFNNVDTIGTSAQRFNTNVNTLSLNGVTGETFITETNGSGNGIDIAELATTGLFDLLVTTGDITDVGDLVTNSPINMTANAGNIILDNNNQLSGELSLIADAGDVTLNNTVNTVLGDVIAQNLSITSNGITDAAGSQITVTNTSNLNGGGQDIVLDGDHEFGELTVSNTNNLTLVDISALTIIDVVVAVNAAITAGGDVRLNNITAGNTASLITTGAIIDANGGANNVTANNMVLHAANGIGSGNGIETATSSLDVVNTASGNVELDNTGAVEIIALKNTGSSGDITIFNDADYNINPGSIVANRAVGNLIMTTQTGSFLGLGDDDINNPDITARNATFFGRAGTFGTFDRPLTLDVPGSVLIDTRASFDPQFVPPGPNTVSTLGLDFSGILGALSAISGEQLVEVETLGEIDEAIFTDLQNYSMEEISIRLPRDQIFEDELEEYDRTSGL